MFHVKHIFLLLLFPLSTLGQAQFFLEDKEFIPSAPVDSTLLTFVLEQGRKRKLNNEEVQFLYWANYLRTNPKGFHKHVVLPFLHFFPEANGVEAKSLVTDLLSQSPLLKYNTSSHLIELAKEQAGDLAEKNGPISHNDSKGRSFSQRMKIGGFTKCASENIYTGKNSGLLALMMLLLDIGMDVPGHRKNILNPGFQQIGVAIEPHRNENRIILVQILGCPQ